MISFHRALGLAGAVAEARDEASTCALEGKWGRGGKLRSASADRRRDEERAV